MIPYSISSVTNKQAMIEVQISSSPKINWWSIMKNWMNNKLGLGDLKNDLKTSMTSEGLEQFFQKLHQAEKNDLCWTQGRKLVILKH